MITYFSKEVKEAESWKRLQENIEDWERHKEAPLQSFDQIPIILKNGEFVTLTVGHDESGKTYFCFEDCIVDRWHMNSEWTNEGGWAASDMRRWLNTTLFALLPDEIQAVIKPTRIVQVIGGERIETEDKLFLFSKTQLFGKGSWSEIEPEDTQIDIFRTEKNRVKECGNLGTSSWWTRSPRSDNSNRFGMVNSDGSANGSYASSSRGVAPGFCIT